MFLLPDKNTFLVEASKFNNSKEVIEQLDKIYDHVKKFIILEDPEGAVNKVLKDMFILPGMKDLVIPYSFYISSVGKVIFSVLYGINEYNTNENTYTITDIIGFTRSDIREKGYSKQYISKQIKDEKLKGVFRNGRWEFTKAQVNNFLKLKGFKQIE